MKKILIFLLISLIFSQNEIEKLLLQSIIKGGIAAFNAWVPAGLIITGYMGPIIDSYFKSDPNAVIIDELNSLRQAITSHLTVIEKEISEIKLDILNQIKGDIYTECLGNALINLYTQIEGIVDALNTNNISQIYTENEKIVENAYLIGGNNKWYEEGNIVFNIKKLANTLAGQTFSNLQGRNFYQIVNDANLPNCMFNGEVYDDSAPYIEKVMQIYFFASMTIMNCLKNAQLLTNFTDADIESLYFSKNALLCMCYKRAWTYYRSNIIHCEYCF